MICKKVRGETYDVHVTVCFMTTFSTNRDWTTSCCKLHTWKGPVKGAGEQNDRREKLAKIYGRSGNEVPSRDSVYSFFFLTSSGRFRDRFARSRARDTLV